MRKDVIEILTNMFGITVMIMLMIIVVMGGISLIKWIYSTL